MGTFCYIPKITVYAISKKTKNLKTKNLLPFFMIIPVINCKPRDFTRLAQDQKSERRKTIPAP
ncbi:MAG: hypothetical protein AEth_00097 [Candidatus Argoarchaeum ethanivorans]|uniref:Uncharacterized protein n=1 Tax=Candidatus Argoarchaeum ethanivorans TaxID=2608793 RepID=A0A8B3S4A1_9EURY|nr:MAG: hypothetical protein AEth_00097 [Candidatus Argoarchaeum ethanivorans]